MQVLPATRQPSKLESRVQFPGAVPVVVAQLAERDLAKVEATGSTPVDGSKRRSEESSGQAFNLVTSGFESRRRFQHTRRTG